MKKRKRMTQFEKGLIQGLQRAEGLVRHIAEEKEFNKEEIDVYEIAAKLKRIWWNLQIDIYNRGSYKGEKNETV